MNGPRTLGLIVTVITGAMVVVAMTTGSFSVEGDVIASLAWGKMTLVDLYGGLALFAATEGHSMNDLFGGHRISPIDAVAVISVEEDFQSF